MKQNLERHAKKGKMGKRKMERLEQLERQEQKCEVLQTQHCNWKKAATDKSVSGKSRRLMQKQTSLTKTWKLKKAKDKSKRLNQRGETWRNGAMRSRGRVRYCREW